MAHKIAVSTLNASTIDILNVIRKNASAQYQSQIPNITDKNQIPQVGEVLFGYPALANEFISALLNRIAAVRIKSATFNNPYVDLKKGYLEFGETVEEVFVNLAKAREFSTEAAASREFKRSLPDVRSAFHVMNFKAQYPMTIQDMDLRQAFTNIDGVQSLIAKVVDSVYIAANYDEFLLFKYLVIKAVSHGQMFPVSIGDGTDAKDAAKKFRGVSNSLQFISTKYNASGVHTASPREDQYIFMDAQYNADFDVDVLASAFNMDKADFFGHLKLIDDFTTFDNDRFSELVADGQMENVTSSELALMANVKAVVVDKEFFQIYDNLTMMTEKYVSNGLYWNYFYNVWKTISYSPYSNAVAFVLSTATITDPSTLTVKVASKDVDADGITTFGLQATDQVTLQDVNLSYEQNASCVNNGVAVLKEGAMLMQDNVINSSTVPISGYINNAHYVSATRIGKSAAVGDSFTLNKQ